MSDNSMKDIKTTEVNAQNNNTGDNKKRKNIILIGMPGSGKSTLGVVLAKKLGYSFIDSDIVIQDTYGKTLEELIDEHGDAGFIKIENDVNCGISCLKRSLSQDLEALKSVELYRMVKQLSRKYLRTGKDCMKSMLTLLLHRRAWI